MEGVAFPGASGADFMTSTSADTCFASLSVAPVINVIDDKNVVTKIMSKSTRLQHIGFNGFAIRH